MMHLREKYQKEVVPQMMEKCGYKNSMAVPKIERVVVNTGFGKQVSDKTSDEKKKIIDFILQDLSSICGQRPVLTKAKKSISSFKLREKSEIGARVTLRGRRMYDFLERLVNIALPRSRDFRGINPKSLDRSGNLTIGIKEHIWFPEISPEKTRLFFGLEITVVTAARNREGALELLKLMGFPFKS